ncbi:beta strand repeat-containing protein, partial [Victivallis vadensis]|uniref:beta strand repeat-containing protein n=1 Tax=Victivallis vadensis TaxID=172901 RepID=UPI0026DC6CEF
ALNINASQTWKAGDDAAVTGLDTINIADGVTWNNLAAIDIAAGSTLKLNDRNNTNPDNGGIWREYTLNGRITGGGRLEYMSSQTNANTSLILGDGLYAGAADGAGIAVGARRLYLNGNGANVTVVSYAPNMILDGIWGGSAVAGAAINQDLTVKVDGVGFSGVTDGIYGGGRDADITGNIRVELANIPGGNAKIDVFGGNVLDSAAGDRGVITGNISITITDSTVGRVLGGSESGGSMTGDISVTLTDSTAGNVYGGGGGTFAVNGNTSVTLTGSTVGSATSAGTVYAGAMQTDGKVTGTAILIVTDSTIYGRVGGSNGSVGRTSITLNGNTVVGGDKVYVESMASSVFGGTVDERGGAGSTFISVGGNTRLLGSAFQTGTAGGNLYGGSRQYSWVTGDTEVEIKDNASIAGSVFGGGIGNGYKGYDGVGGNTSITVSGSAEVVGDIYGGGETSNGDDGGYSVKGNTEITIRDNAGVHSIYAGGKAGTVGGTGTITVCGGTFAAGSVIDGANVAGGTTLNLENAASVTEVTFRNLALVNVKQDMAYSLNRFVNVAEISISAGKTLTLDAANTDVTLGSDVTGDGKFAVNARDFYANGKSVTLSDSTITGKVTGATYTTPGGKDFTSTDLTLNNAAVTGDVYGGSYYTGHVGSAKVTINGGTYNGRVYGGSITDYYYDEITVDHAETVITAGTFAKEVYGGSGAASSVKLGSSLTISGGTFSNSVFGGGGGGSFVGGYTLDAGNVPVEDASLPKADSTLTITGGTFNTKSSNSIGGVYGGNAHGFVTGNASVAVTGTDTVSITGPVVGGNNASSPSGRAANYIGGNASVIIGNAHAVIAGNVAGGSSSRKYEGGGSATLVKGNSSVTISAGTVNGNLYGGGFGISGGISTVNGNTSVTVSGGTVNGNIYAGGNEFSTVGGNATLTVSGGNITADLIDGCNVSVDGTSTFVYDDAATFSVRTVRNFDKLVINRNADLTGTEFKEIGALELGAGVDDVKFGKLTFSADASLTVGKNTTLRGEFTLGKRNSEVVQKADITGTMTGAGGESVLYVSGKRAEVNLSGDISNAAHGIKFGGNELIVDTIGSMDLSTGSRYTYCNGIFANSDNGDLTTVVGRMTGRISVEEFGGQFANGIFMDGGASSTFKLNEFAAGASIRAYSAGGFASGFSNQADFDGNAPADVRGTAVALTEIAPLAGSIEAYADQYAAVGVNVSGEARGDLTVGTLSGSIYAELSQSSNYHEGAYGLMTGTENADGTSILTVRDLSGTVAANAVSAKNDDGRTMAYGLVAGTSVNATISGTVFAGSYQGNDLMAKLAGVRNGSVAADSLAAYATGIAIVGGSRSDTITLKSGAMIFGDIDLGTGDDTLTMENGVTVNGKISLGDGNDKITVNGTFSGTIDLGGGQNTLTISAATDLTNSTLTGTLSRLEVAAGKTGTVAVDDALLAASGELCISVDGRSYDSTEAAVSVTAPLDSSLSISIEVPAVWGGAESAKEIILIRNLTGSVGGLGVDGMTITVFGKLGKLSSELGSAQVGGAATVDFGMGANWGLKLNANGDLVFYNDMPRTLAAFNEPSIASAMNCLATENIVSGCGSTLDALNLNLDADNKKQLA